MLEWVYHPHTCVHRRYHCRRLILHFGRRRGKVQLLHLSAPRGLQPPKIVPQRASYIRHLTNQPPSHPPPIKVSAKQLHCSMDPTPLHTPVHLTVTNEMPRCKSIFHPSDTAFDRIYCNAFVVGSIIQQSPAPDFKECIARCNVLKNCRAAVFNNSTEPASCLLKSMEGTAELGYVKGRYVALHVKDQLAASAGPQDPLPTTHSASISPTLTQLQQSTRSTIYKTSKHFASEPCEQK